MPDNHTTRPSRNRGAKRILAPQENSALFSEKRGAKRFFAPFGTKATFLSSLDSLDTAWVLDISVTGMLLCCGNSTNIYPLKSSIYNIYVDVPTNELSAVNQICFIIDKGIVVRSFTDQASGNFCYGVELTYENTYLKKRIECLGNKT